MFNLFRKINFIEFKVGENQSIIVRISSIDAVQKLNLHNKQEETLFLMKLIMKNGSSNDLSFSTEEIRDSVYSATKKQLNK